MARKKKRWRDMDDPADIFGSERARESVGQAADPAYDAFRRHIEEHIQGETRAFHELRSTAEHELQAAAVTTSPPGNAPPARKSPPMENRKPAPKAPPPVMPAPIKNHGYGNGVGTLVMQGLIFTAIGFLLHSVWQQTQPASRKVASTPKSRQTADANCANEKLSPAKKINMAAVKPAVIPVQAEAEATTPTVSLESAAALDSQPATESSLKGITLRAVEMRKGPGGTFEIVDSLPPGFALEGHLTTDRNWLRVKPGAFVSADAVLFQDASTAGGYQSHWVGTHIANIREFPLLTAKVVRKADPGTELKLQVFNTEWAQVSGGGFVFRKLVTSEAPRLLKLPALMRVTVEKAEIRGGPGQQYPVLGLYFRNHKLEVQELQGSWLRVGPEQYIRAQELELSVKPGSEKTM